MGEQLPVYKIKGKLYFRDERLGEYREVRNFENTICIDDINNEDLQKASVADRKKAYGGV